ncbi:hypothetical protein AB0M23_16250 [Streptomyces sp. NPDC052077]|uniref:hypothetical protein n=1 Tax=Streptomyces sp. NPDC052077 TaxID=3154757 RepID=UPI00342D168C
MASVARRNTVVDAALLDTATRRIITRAVADVWPGREAVLGPRCPSAASYLCRVVVDGEELVARYDWLGLPLGAVLRGAGGTWAQVRQAQRPYLANADPLTAREARHLDRLRSLGRPRVCGTAGLRGGVLLTRTAPGTPVSDVLAARPWETGMLLDEILGALAALHGPPGAGCLRGVATVGERSVVRVFRRTFGGPTATARLRVLGRGGVIPEDARRRAVVPMGSAARRLLPMAEALPAQRETAVFGNLDPEHVLLDGPRLTFTRPAVRWAAGPQPDLATLLGRAVLVAAAHPEPRVARQIVRGVAATLERHLARLPGRERTARLREVALLWLMDTLNVLADCLGAPPELPLSARRRALVPHAPVVAAVADRMSAVLTGSLTGPALLDALLAEADQTVGRAGDGAATRGSGGRGPTVRGRW